MRNFPLLAVLTLLSFWTTGANGQTTTFEFLMFPDTFSFELPNSFKSQLNHYTEGTYFYYYQDTTLLVLHNGSMVRLPHLNDSTYTVERTDGRDRSGTRTTNNKYWREVNLGHGINAYYKDTNEQSKELLDKILNDLITWRKENGR